MSQNNLSKALFHGTIETLKPGDVIKAPENGTAWATSDLSYALDHAKDRTNSGYGVNPGGEYPVHHGHVYEVEPMGEYKDHSEDKTIFTGNSFKVKNQVASVLGRADNVSVIKKKFPSFDPSKESYVKNGRNMPMGE